MPLLSKIKKLNKKKKKKLIRLSGITLIILIVITVFASQMLVPPSKEKMLKNFNDSYQEQITPNGNVVEVDLVASPGQIEIAEDKYIYAWSYNGQIPGPEFRLNLGDTLKINFTNSLPDETTIHFHGVRVPNAMDGVPGVTQDPILPGESFVYEFTPKDAGTFWFHPHVRGSEQVERGLYGMIVVEDPTEPKYDQDKVVVLDDWRLDQYGNIDSNFNTRMDLMHDGRWGNFQTVNGSSDYTIPANPGERLRLRFVNPSNGRVYKLSFGDLDIKGIAVDGMLARESFDPEGFEVAPGNRLDVDIKIPLSAVGNSFVVKDTFNNQSNKLFTIVTTDTPVDQVKKFAPPSAEKFANWQKASQLPVDEEYLLEARQGGEFGIEWTINDKAYPEYDPITLKHNTFNKIRFNNMSARLHPMHLHGQFFQVLAIDDEPVDEPYWRDTVLLHSFETIDIGVVPLDIGKWASHCHILEHAEAGMMTIIEVK